MRKIFSIIVLTLCLLLVSCGKDTAAVFPENLDALIATFNDRAIEAGCELGETAAADDGTTAVATRNENSYVYCTEGEDGTLKKIEVLGTGIFQPGLGSFDYMVYSVVACDRSLDYKSAGDLIASMYYEAYTGGDPVVMSYGGMKFAFKKDNYYCSLAIEPDAGAQ